MYRILRYNYQGNSGKIKRAKMITIILVIPLYNPAKPFLAIAPLSWYQKNKAAALTCLIIFSPDLSVMGGDDFQCNGKP